MPAPTDPALEAALKRWAGPLPGNAITELCALLESCGYELRKKPMSPKERALIALPAANRARREKMAARRAAVRAQINLLRAEHGAISDLEAAEHLNAAGIKPLRGRQWTSLGVRRLMNRNDNGDRPQTT